MGEEVGGVPEAAPVGSGGTAADEAGTGGSIGRYLARQRQLREISLQDLAELTKIPVRSLERLEAGAFDAVPDGFARGFVRTVAEALGLDPDDAVMRLMREPPEEEPASAGMAAAGGPILGVGLLLAAGLLLGLAWRLLAGWLTPGEAPAATEVILREDPVRALALEQSRRAASPSAGAVAGSEPEDPAEPVASPSAADPAAVGSQPEGPAKPTAPPAP